jgi:tetratricopeptide (TPR) repeat protein
MPPGSEQARINPKMVGAALRSLANGSLPARDLSPLLALFLVQRMVLDGVAPEVEEARFIALGRVLIGLIKRHLAACRRQVGLLALTGAEDRARIEADLVVVSATRHEVLGQWMTLYCRFVRVDLGFHFDELVSAYRLPKRSVERMQHVGLRRLTRALLWAEWHAKLTDRRSAMMAVLGGERVTPLVGRQEAVAEIARWFDEGRQRLLVSGPLGVGKTAFARALAEAVIGRCSIQQVVWMDTPPSADAVLLKLREQAAKQGYRDIDLRAYLYANETLLVLDDLRAFAHDPAALDDLLRSLPDTHVVLSHAHYLALETLTARHVLEPLSPADTLELARRLWQRRAEGMASVQPDLEMMALESGGNPLALKMLVMSYRSRTKESLAHLGVPMLYQRTRALLPEEGQRLWPVLALLPSGGVPLEDVQAVWPDVATVAALDALLACHVATYSGDPEICGLADYARRCIAHGARSDAFTRDVLEWAVEQLDEDRALLVPSCHLIRERVLIESWLPLAEERKLRWIAQGWRASARTGMWSAWLGLLREATEAAAQDASLWTGRGVCARRLALWQECEDAFQQAMKLGGDEGDFDVQAEAQLEYSVMLRMHGRFAEAEAAQERVWMHVKGREIPLKAQTAFERAQMAVECRHGEEALTWLVDTPACARKHLLTGEALWLLGDYSAAHGAALAGLDRLAADHAGQGKAHDLMGRALFAQNNVAAAESAYTQAMALLDAAGDEYYATRTRVNLSGLLLQTGRGQEAYNLLYDRELVCQRMGDRMGLYAVRRLLTEARTKLVRRSDS